MKKLTNNLFWLLALGSAALFYLPLASHALWDSDEGRYAEIAREMLELKDWITPHLNYVVYLEKPPLMYWLMALSFKVFGFNAFAARFWCASFGVATVLVTYWMGKSWKNERVGLLAGGILATSLGFFALTQFVVLDMALTFWMSVILFCGCRLLQEKSVHTLRRLTYVLAIALAGGILTKGPVALVLPLVTLAIVFAGQKWNWTLSHMPLRAAFVLFAILALPWFVLITLRQPIFPWFFFVHEHLLRFLTTVHHRVEPFYFFLPVILIGFWPWSVFLPRVWKTWLTGHRRALWQRDPQGAVLGLWVLLVFVFFSLSQSKLVGYILPIFPALALLIAQELDLAWGQDGRAAMPPWVSGGVMAGVALFMGGLLVLKLPVRWSWATNPQWILFLGRADALTIVLGLGVFVFVGAWGMRQTRACFIGILFMQVLLLLTVSSFAGVADPFLSTAGIAARILATGSPSDRVVGYSVAYENVLQTLPFYLRRRVAVWGPPGELALGQSLDPDATSWFVSADSAEAALGTLPSSSWVITDDEHGRSLNLRYPGAFESVLKQGMLALFRRR